MLQYQLQFRLFLVAFFGVLYIFAMKKMARHASVETTPKRHVVLKIISFLNLLSSVICMVTGIYLLHKMQYPENTITDTFSPYQIVHTYDEFCWWGYPTQQQNQAIMSITNVFSGLALAVYCFYFEKSDSRWWNRVLKFIYGVLMYMFFCSATNFHYFDSAEFIPAGLFLTTIIIVHIVARTRETTEALSVPTEDSYVASFVSTAPHEDTSVHHTPPTDHTRYMPKSNTDIGVAQQSSIESDLQQDEETQDVDL